MTAVFSAIFVMGITLACIGVWQVFRKIEYAIVDVPEWDDGATSPPLPPAAPSVAQIHSQATAPDRFPASSATSKVA